MAYRREADVVDLGIRAPRAAARNRYLEFPRQVVEGRVAVEHLRAGVDQRRSIRQLVGVETGERTAGDVAGDVAARAERGHALQPERAEDFGQALELDPVQLDVLANRDVADAAAVPLGQVGDGPQLMGLESAVGDPDPHHEVADGLALAVLAPDRADSVALGVDPPPAEIRAEPFRRHRVPALAREAEDVFVGLPRILLTLEALHALRLGLFHGFAHCRLRLYPRYRSGTSTHDLHREHLAVTRPVGESTFKIALWITTSSCSLTTTLARQTGHRELPSSPGSLMGSQSTHSRSRLSR